jgi:hypothetical protein
MNPHGQVLVNLTLGQGGRGMRMMTVVPQPMRGRPNSFVNHG